MDQQNENAATAEVRHSTDGLFVHYGFVHRGAFHPVASERLGDYEDRVHEAQQQEQEG